VDLFAGQKWCIFGTPGNTLKAGGTCTWKNMLQGGVVNFIKKARNQGLRTYTRKENSGAALGDPRSIILPYYYSPYLQFMLKLVRYHNLVVTTKGL